MMTFIAFIIALGTLVIIHELGHYSVARACGVRILRFSVGFGRSLYTRKDQYGTEWRIGILPLGGYVKMVDEREGPVSDTDLPYAFNRKTLWQRAAIVLAGPVANLLLAICIYTGLNLVGMDEPLPIIATPMIGSLASQAGFEGGDVIQRIDDANVASWNDARWLLLQRASDRARTIVEVKDSREMTKIRTLNFSEVTSDELNADFLKSLGLDLMPSKILVQSVIADSAAAQAGLQADDRILQVNQQPAQQTSQVVNLIRQSAGKTLDFMVERNGMKLNLSIIPRIEAENNQPNAAVVGRIGAQLASQLEMLNVHYGLGRSMWLGAKKTLDQSWFSLRMLGKMLQGEVSWKNLSGPVSIAEYAGVTAKLGLSYYLSFLALMSVSLGVLNLLPIPVLDGGHLLYYLVEFVKGSPLSERWVGWGQRVGLGLLFLMMALALFNDVSRLIFS